MTRTQIYLTEEERRALRAMAERTGKSQSQLIREAVDRFIDSQQDEHRAAALEAAFGLWSGRDDLEDLQVVRRELDRFTPEF